MTKPTKPRRRNASRGVFLNLIGWRNFCPGCARRGLPLSPAAIRLIRFLALQIVEEMEREQDALAAANGG